MSEQIECFTWNVKQGGFPTYTTNSLVPDRGEAIRAYVGSQRDDGVSIATLTDTHRWDITYGGGAGIADFLGFKSGHHLPLDDSRLNGMYDGHGAEIGVSFVTNEPVDCFGEIDLGNRRNPEAILKVGEHGLRVACTYLDDLNEQVRLKQVQALVAHLRRHDVPTVITGDLNTLRAQLEDPSFRATLGSVAVRTLAAIIPPVPGKAKKIERIGYYRTAFREMDQRSVIPTLAAAGYTDADPMGQPTIPAVFPVWGLDYALAGQGARAQNVHVLPKGPSDHRPIRFTTSIAA